MPLEGLRSSVGVVPTDLTVVVDVEAVEFIQPVGNGLQETRKEQSQECLRLLPKWEMGRKTVMLGLTLPSQPRGRFLGL